ncbi:MAG TPA: hypothetical protein VEC16_03110 [Alphaproteobacteria bacterium]|nr:hypothetical protein [Alphaproteobacteria bacterium]
MVRELSTEKKYKGFFILGLILALVVISGCSGTSNAQRRYYTGYESVEMRFLQDTPPTIFYYDSQASPTQFDQNTIPINVEVYNRGSSDTFGALFIHGFDPNIVAVQGYTPNYPGYTGPLRSSSFGGWYGDSDNFALNIGGIPIGNAVLNLGVANINGRKSVSFSTFGFTNRGNFFSALGYAGGGSAYAGYTGINAGVVQARIGSVLNPITQALFNSFNWGAWLKKFQLEGRNPNNPAGGMEVIEFPATILTLPPSLEQFTQRVMVTSCFDYATHASTMVCIDPEPYSNVKKACRPQTVGLSGGQGAPVAITSIEQRPGRGRTTFVINVQHSPRNSFDELYDYFSLYKCDPASGEVVKSTDKNVVYVGYVYLSDFDITMSCIPDQVIRLDDSGRGQITCSIEFPKGIDGKPITASAYQAPMEIELWYGYSKTIFRDVVIRRI